VTTSAGSRLITRRDSSKRRGLTIAFASPVSSSSVMKQKPFAVPGRWRVMTEPQMLTLSLAAHRAAAPRCACREAWASPFP